MNCPQCHSDDLHIAPFETHDAEANYHERGFTVECHTCGAVSTEEDMEHAAHVEAAYVEYGQDVCF